MLRFWSVVGLTLILSLMLVELCSAEVVLHACNGHEWFGSRSRVSHEEAVRACRNVGFYLQSPTNQSDRKCSKSKFPRLFSDRFWTGFHRDPITPTSFHYELYGKQHSITQDAISWKMNEGQNVNEMCVAQLYNSRHADLPCTELAYYICQRRPIPHGQPGAWGSWRPCRPSGTTKREACGGPVKACHRFTQYEKCSAVLQDCPVLAAPVNGIMMPNSDKKLYYGQVKNFSCSEGHALRDSSSKSRSCLKNGTWSGVDAVCDRVKCPPLRNPANGVVFSNPNEDGVNWLGTVKRFSCFAGNYLRRKSSHSRQCQKDGRWSGAVAECLPLSCDPPSQESGVASVITLLAIANTTGVREKIAVAKLVQSCRSGFLTYGNSKRRCLAECVSIAGSGSHSTCHRYNTSWDGTPPTCRRKSCGLLNAPSYGKIVQSQLGNFTIKTAAGSVGGLFEQSVTIGCDNGYRLASPQHNRYTCADSGQWTVVGEHPRCVPVCLGVVCPVLRQCIVSPADGSTHECVCDSSSTCQDIYEPVCGSDGVSYSSPCLMQVNACSESRTISKVADGFCKVGKLQCPPSYCALLAAGTCSLNGVVPANSCSDQGLMVNDVGIFARILINSTATCTANNGEHTITLRVRKELHKNAQRCNSFMPGIVDGQRYNVKMVLKFENGCPCPVTRTQVSYIVTATCDPKLKVLRANAFSLFRERNSKTEGALKRQCKWNWN